MKILLALVLLFGSECWADQLDRVQLKNGDVIKGTVIEQKLGVYVQVLLRDGNERRIRWEDIETIDKPHTAGTLAAPDHGNGDSAFGGSTVPAVNDNADGSFRIDIDFRPYDYTTHWTDLSITANGSATASKISSIQRLSRTVPPIVDLRAYLPRVTLNATLDATQTAGSFAVGYALSKELPRSEVGLSFAFNRSDTSSTASNVSTTFDPAENFR